MEESTIGRLTHRLPRTDMVRHSGAKVGIEVGSDFAAEFAPLVTRESIVRVFIGNLRHQLALRST